MFRQNLNDDIGQAFVELALVFPVFLLLLLGTAAVGRMAYAAIEVNNAARAGVAYGAMTHTTASDSGPSGGMVQAAKAEAPDIPNLSATATLSCSCESSTGTLGASVSCTTIDTTAGSCPSPKRIVEFVQVNTSASIDTVFHFPGIPNSVTFNGQASMRVEQ